MKNFVIGSMYWINPNATPDELRNDMQQVRDNGLTLLRTFICWEYVEVRQDQFDFSMVDRFFRAAEEYGIRLMPTLIFYPPFYLIRDYLKQGIDDRARRVPCLDRPEVQTALARFIRETVTRYHASPALQMWNIWNEPTDPICHCPHSVKAFADYLRKKYPDMTALREAWAGEYYIFNPVLPESMDALNEDFIRDVLTCASRERDTGMRLDWREFNMLHAAGHAAWLVREVRKYDTGHECHANPAQRGNAMDWGGVNAYLFAKELGSISGSVHPHNFCDKLKPGVRYSDILPMLTYIDRFRSWGQGKDCYIGEYQAGATYQKPNAYTPRGRDHFASLFHALARNLNGVIFWEWQAWRQSFFEVGEFSLRNPSDGGPTERSLAVRRFAEIYRKHKAFFDGAQMRAPEVAIFESMDQNAYEIESPAEAMREAHALSAMLCHRTLAAAGIKADFVTECLLADNVLARYKVLIVPNVQLISPATAEALKKFVQAGGAVWADGRCGFLDAHTFLRKCVPCNGLDRLFGCRETDEVAPYPEDELETRYGKIPPYRILQRLEVYPGAEAIATCNGYPAAVRRKKTEYWGTPLFWGDVQNGTDHADQIIVDFVRRNGVNPEIAFTGKGCLVSCIQDGVRRAVVVTNDTPQTAEFRIAEAAYEEWVHEASYTVEKNEAVWRIPAGETYCIAHS